MSLMRLTAAIADKMDKCMLTATKVDEGASDIKI